MKKYLVGLCATVLVIGSAFAITQTKKTRLANDFYYRYTGPSVSPNTNLAPYQDEANWTTSSASDPSCGGISYPCKVEVTQSTLHDYVSSISTATDVTGVTIASKN